MKNSDRFSSPLWRDRALGAAAVAEMEKLAPRAAALTGGRVNFMEVCGTHTMAIAASGMRSSRCFPAPAAPSASLRRGI